MKLLVVSQHFWPEQFRVNDICEGLVEKGNEVDVLTGLPNYPKGKFFEGYSWTNRGEKEHKGIKITRIPILERGIDSKFGLILNYISFVLSSLFFIPKLIKNKYDKVIVYQTSPITMAIPAVILKKLTNIESYIYILDLWPQSLFSIVNIKSKYIRKLSNKFCSRIYKSFDNIWITSKGFEKELNKMGISSNNIEYIPQWAEDLYKKNIDIDKDDDLYKFKDKFNLVFAGNIGKAQSVDSIIKAANLCKEYEKINWIILGDGSEKDNMEKLSEEMGLNHCVKFLGRKPIDDMPKYFSLADGLLITLRDDDLFKITVPAKLQSYMASGKPILGCISGESKQLIEDSECGFACESKDYNAFAKNVIKLYNMNSYEREQLGNNGAKYFNENFERNKILNNINDKLK